ncbi:MAG: hypothetical protein GEEBNDBF_00153 [bacterium]|nr:hypothetical protein [bacterium]
MAAAPSGETVTLTVRVKPGSRQVRVLREGDTLRVEVTARAIEGQANAAVMKAIAAAFGIRPWQVALVAGDKSRAKRFALDISAARFQERWAALEDH